MRRIITTRYGYCCEKVFSYAPYNDDVLAVQANKWGGCCVEWWYHVAPLVRVRLKLRLPRLPKDFSIVLAMVIDPGMFDKPVLLSTWLAAQENKTCNPQAKVSAYSIQPGSAYTPGWNGPVRHRPQLHGHRGDAARVSEPDDLLTGRRAPSSCRTPETTPPMSRNASAG